MGLLLKPPKSRMGLLLKPLKNSELKGFLKPLHILTLKKKLQLKKKKK